MDWNRLVAIWFVGKRKQKPSFGTGYLIAPNRILTAAHILKPNWSKIVVYFADADYQCELTPPKSNGSPVIAYNGYDRGSDRLDALIISCEGAPPLSSAVPLLHEPPKLPSEWYSNCFPEFAIGEKPPGKDNYFDARGKLNPPPRDILKFQVECEEKRQVPAQWRGISGGPVLINTTLAGVLVEVKLGKTIRSSDGSSVAPLERLHVTPAWKLMEDPAFPQALGGVTRRQLDESENQWKSWLATQLRVELRYLLEPEVAELFEAYCERPLNSERASMEAITGDLVRDPEKVYRISEMRRECGRRGVQSAAKALENIENLLLPRLFPPEERERFWNALKYGGAILVDHAATCSLAAEGRMANYDGRKMEFPVDQSIAELQKWRGRGALQLDLVRPGKPTARVVAFRLLLQLAGQALPADQLTVTQDARDAILTERAMDKTISDALQHAEQLGKRLDAALDVRSRLHGTPYCVVRVPETGLSTESFRDALEILRTWVSKLEFLEISRQSPYGHHETPLLTLLSNRVEE